MELKTKVSIEVTRSEGDSSRLYQFIMPYGANIGEAYDVCHEMLQKIVEMAQTANERAKSKQEETKN